MRKFLTLIALVALPLIAAAGPFPPSAITVGTNSTMVLPPAVVGNPALWEASTAYAQGAIVKVSSNSTQRLWAAVAGTTSTNAPVLGTDDTVVDGSVTWALVHQGRAGFVLVNAGTGTVYVAYDHAAVSGKGIMLAPNGVVNEGPGFLGSVSAVATAPCVLTLLEK